ncbi:MAG TPA: DUF3703 domain-containing protein [Acidimicrobiales bacterium]|nr:DUF3703 domain-containing protein [Acidimicrobiales bacterium]
MTTTERMTAARHPRVTRSEAITAAITTDRDAARAARRGGGLDEAWRLLERTHILSQPWAWPHVRSHLDMLRLAVHARDRGEIVGQIVRTLVAGPGSATGRYPLGNTGRATVAATQPMPVPDDLARLLAPR